MNTLATVLAMAAPYLLRDDPASRVGRPATRGPVDTSPYNPDAAAKIREERAARKAANFAKRNKK
jgi:hypothetical protein